MPSFFIASPIDKVQGQGKPSPYKTRKMLVQITRSYPVVIQLIKDNGRGMIGGGEVAAGFQPSLKLLGNGSRFSTGTNAGRVWGERQLSSMPTWCTHEMVQCGAQVFWV